MCTPIRLACIPIWFPIVLRRFKSLIAPNVIFQGYCGTESNLMGFIFYVGPQFGITLSPWVSGMIAIGLHYSCYLSEVYRGGLDSVPKGQWEAATALNMTTAQTYKRLIIPQAIPPAIPGLGNYLVGIFKDTPMLSVIGVAELIHTANSIGSETWRYLEAYTMVGVIFLALSLPAAGLIRAFEGFVRRKLGM